MSPAPPRDTPSGRTYNNLRNLARRQGRDVAEYLSLFALEGFLARLSASQYADQLILKGGVLMAAFSARRPTRDIDLSASGFPNDVVEAEGRVRSIAAIGIDDDLIFVTSSVRGEEIRDDSEYHGVRVHIIARLASAEIPFHVDVNFGDPVWPAPVRTGLPRLLGGQIDVLAYPVTMVLAEKIVTVVERGAANTRWRDFVDVASLATKADISGDDMIRSLAIVAASRQIVKCWTEWQTMRNENGRLGGANNISTPRHPSTSRISLTAALPSLIRCFGGKSTGFIGRRTTIDGPDTPMVSDLRPLLVVHHTSIDE